MRRLSLHIRQSSVCTSLSRRKLLLMEEHEGGARPDRRLRLPHCAATRDAGGSNGNEMICLETVERHVVSCQAALPLHDTVSELFLFLPKGKSSRAGTSFKLVHEVFRTFRPDF